MSIDVVIPARRDPSRLLFSLEHQTHTVDNVWIVSNEIERLRFRPKNVHLVRFSSQELAYGESDVVLRRNLGISLSEADVVVLQDDDQVAPSGMIEACWRKTLDKPFVWGHHRFIDMDAQDVDQLMDFHPNLGREREHPPNAPHGWFSCYAGMAAFRRSFFWEVGGFDMAFLGRHAGEDQNLGRRMMRHVGDKNVFIHEPPFAWHPVMPYRREYLPVTGNVCADGHQTLTRTTINGVEFQLCARCPYRAPAPEEKLLEDRVVIPFDPALVVWSIE